MTDLNKMPRIILKDVNVEEKNVNIDNVSSRNVNSNNVKCTDKSHHGKGFINCTNVSRKRQEGCYFHLERCCHVCKVADRGVDKFETCANCQCVFYCSKSCHYKGGNRMKQSVIQ